MPSRARAAAFPDRDALARALESDLAHASLDGVGAFGEARMFGPRRDDRPRADVERYDALRTTQEVRHAS